VCCILCFRLFSLTESFAQAAGIYRSTTPRPVIVLRQPKDQHAVFVVQLFARESEGIPYPLSSKSKPDEIHYEDASDYGLPSSHWQWKVIMHVGHVQIPDLLEVDPSWELPDALEADKLEQLITKLNNPERHGPPAYPSQHP
jgi:hypothetical protein